MRRKMNLMKAVEIGFPILDADPTLSRDALAERIGCSQECAADVKRRWQRNHDCLPTLDRILEDGPRNEREEDIVQLYMEQQKAILRAKREGLDSQRVPLRVKVLVKEERPYNDPDTWWVWRIVTPAKTRSGWV